MQFRVNIRKVKSALWGASAVAFVFAGWTFYDILRGKQQGRYQWKDSSHYHAVLQSQLSDDKDLARGPAFYSKERYESMWKARIDGSVKPQDEPLVPSDDTQLEVEKVIEPLDSVLKVGMLVWSDEPLSRFIAVHYLDAGGRPQTNAAGKQRRLHLMEGEPLRSPYDEDPYFGKALRIDPQTVTFAWADDEVTLTPGLGRDGQGVPIDEFDIAMRKDPTADFTSEPLESVDLGGGAEWILGTKDRLQIQENSQQILEDLSVRTITPSSGGHSYIELKNVQPNTLPSKYGFASGDRIISVNGIPMPSVPAAINWAKNNPDLGTYDILYERRGVQQNKVIYVK